MLWDELKPFKKKSQLALRRQDDDNPFVALQRRMNQIFDDFFRGFDLAPVGYFGSDGSFVPQLNISEDEKEIVVTAELPGIDQKDIEVSITKDYLTISGEKKSEVEDKQKNYHRIERSYGSFCRTIALPEGIDESKAEAELKKGVLKIRIPKTEEAQPQRRKIEVKGE